ncbi:MAG TPA: DivIVA domain-containing protein [Erysipelotrichaceae bacterium]|jgi:DivIVA domain-containing protein|nr:DivIVA domain-containing protein [Erysipelotrichia bacterium]HPX32709.1 DivIVA domain-containing protein [Erysipelotrichaceae bacterium]HQA85273.1 DivIVA domain-containing protein [Erysipelotrichaceae bacterium]
MEKNIILDIDTILNKEFSIDFKGYSPIEVDTFLDAVVRDYDGFQQLIIELKNQIAFLQNANDGLKERIVDLETKISQSEENNANQSPVVSNLSQVDILRRIARLEQEVFNRK